MKPTIAVEELKKSESSQTQKDKVKDPAIQSIVREELDFTKQKSDEYNDSARMLLNQDDKD